MVVPGEMPGTAAGTGRSCLGWAYRIPRLGNLVLRQLGLPRFEFWFSNRCASLVEEDTGNLKIEKKFEEFQHG